MQIILKATITINFQIWKDSPGCVDETGRLNLAYLAMDPCEWQDEVRPRKRSTKRLDKTLRKESERNRSSDHVESDEASAPETVPERSLAARGGTSHVTAPQMRRRHRTVPRRIRRRTQH